MRSVHHTLSLLLLPPQGEDSSHSSPAPAWGPSHGRQSSMNFSSVSPSHRLQFFTNCTSVGPFHEVQSFRNRLLQHGSPAGSQVLPANLLQHGLLYPWGHRSCQEPAPAWASHRVTASFGHPPALAWGPLSRGCRWISAPLWTSMGCRGTACLTMVFPMGCRGISAPAPGAPPPPPSSLTLVSAELFLSHLLTPLSLAATATPL